jgi:hypothetical protein
MKNIKNNNSKQQPHGYQELYGYANNKLYYRGNYKNNNMINYSEYHFYKITRYHIK